MTLYKVQFNVAMQQYIAQYRDKVSSWLDTLESANEWIYDKLQKDKYGNL